MPGGTPSTQFKTRLVKYVIPELMIFCKKYSTRAVHFFFVFYTRTFFTQLLDFFLPGYFTFPLNIYYHGFSIF